MATVYHPSAAPTGFHPLQGISAWFSRAYGNWMQKRRHARDLADLAQFSDRDLWDVGLSRSDMMALEKGVFRRD